MSYVINALKGKWDLEHVHIIYSAKTVIRAQFGVYSAYIIPVLIISHYSRVQRPQILQNVLKWKLLCAKCKSWGGKKSHVLSLTQCNTYLSVIL